MPGAQPHPQASWAKKEKRPQVVRQGRNRTALPAQWFYGCSVISPANQLFCHRRLRGISQACPLHWRDRTTRLDRTRRTARLAAQPASIATRLTSGDEWPSRPSCRGGTIRDVALFPIFGKWRELRQINATGKFEQCPNQLAPNKIENAQWQISSHRAVARSPRISRALRRTRSS